MRLLRLLLFLLIIVFPYQALQARISTQHYGLGQVGDSTTIEKQTSHGFDSLIHAHPFLQNPVIFSIEQHRNRVDKTADFYVILLMVLLLGTIRFTNPRYFRNMFRAFANPSLSSRTLKDQIQHDSLPDFLMNVFFCFSAGAYIYYAVKLFIPGQTHTFPAFILLMMIISGMSLIYVIKFLVIRFSGWAFKVESITEQYNFNVFLVNKVLAVVLLPFVILLAFAGPDVAKALFTISAILAGLLLLNRYIRSWQLFGAFFQYSKFHFFMYLCASELLPLAVLMKLLVRGLIYI